MEPYAVTDVVLTLLLYENQMERLQDPDEQPGHDWLMGEMEVCRTLYRMEQRGVGFRAADCLAAAHPIKAEMDRLQDTLPYKPTLAKARSYYFDDPPKGLGLLWHKATAGTRDKEGVKPIAALDEEVRRMLVKQGAPHAKDYDRWCELETAWSMWYQSWPNMTGADGRLRTNYRQTKVVSGRFSVERVQLQAIPHDYQLDHLAALGVPPIRTYFEAKPGHRLWELDVSQAEVRVATWWSDCRAMRKALLAGEDSHDVTCRLIYGIEKDNPEWKRKRSIAKRIRLGTIYGGGAGRIREEILRLDGIDFDVDELRILIAADRRVFPEFQRASYTAQQVAEREGVVRLAGGGYRWFTPWERSSDAHKAFNQVIQGSVAQIMNRWMLAVEQKWSGTLLLQIHDSLVLELPEDESEIAQEAADVGAQIFESFCDLPFPVDTKEWGES
jgi:DNA polymerase I-like protein with 3'-5' exonuclease and polymerase domains